MSPPFDAADATGLFGPGSVSWQVDRELVVLAGGSCALLLQAAHPIVAAGVAEHSTYASDPFGRLLRTLTSSFDVVFGTRTEAEATIRRVNAIHASVRGRLPDDGTPYSALDPEALLWVHATLVDTALRVYGRFVRPLTAAQEQGYHEEAGEVAVRLGVVPDSLPPDIAALRKWMDRMIASGQVMSRRRRAASRGRCCTRSRGSRGWHGMRRISSRSRRCGRRSAGSTASAGRATASGGSSGSRRRAAACCHWCHRLCVTPRRPGPRSVGCLSSAERPGSGRGSPRPAPRRAPGCAPSCPPPWQTPGDVAADADGVADARLDHGSLHTAPAEGREDGAGA